MCKWQRALYITLHVIRHTQGLAQPGLPAAHMGVAYVASVALAHHVCDRGC